MHESARSGAGLACGCCQLDLLSCATHAGDGPSCTCCQTADVSDPTGGAGVAAGAATLDGEPLNAKPPSFSPARLVGSVSSGERRDAGVSLSSVVLVGTEDVGGGSLDGYRWMMSVTVRTRCLVCIVNSRNPVRWAPAGV